MPYFTSLTTAASSSPSTFSQSLAIRYSWLSITFSPNSDCSEALKSR